MDPERFSSSQAWHLGSNAMEASLAGFEFGLLAIQAAFERYVVQLSRLVGEPELAFSEVVILHVVRMHDRPKDTATIARLINRDDLPNVQYALRKLVSLGLVEKERHGTGAMMAATDAGREWTDRFAALRSKLLVDLMASGELLEEEIFDGFGDRLMVLTGLYEASTRRACILNPQGLFADAEN